MWRRIELRNFRSFEGARVDLAPFTLLVGPNASGKSNFVDGFVLAREFGVDAATAIERRGGIVGVRRWSPSKPYDVSLEVRAAATRTELDTDYVRHACSIRARSEGRWGFQSETIEVARSGNIEFQLARLGKQVSLVRDGKPVETRDPEDLFRALAETASLMLFARQFRDLRRFRALTSVRPIKLNPEVMRQPQIATDNFHLETNGANIATAIRHLRESDEEFRGVLDGMRRIVPGLVDVRPEPAGRYLTLVFTQEQSGGRRADFAATEMSEGSLRALGIMVAASQMSRDELLVIEEPEVNIHPGAAGVLVDVLHSAAQTGGVLLTTHSPELLDAARDEEILVCDYRDGISRIGPLSSAQREVVRKGLLSVSELIRSEPLRIEGDAPKLLPSATA